MAHYDYKVVPAPKRAKRVRGVRGAEELFAITLTEAINEVARQGWEYVRAEHLPAESPGGWFRVSTSGEQTVLVFRRDRETLGPRLASVRAETEVPGPQAETTMALAAERAAVERVQASLRHREPQLRAERLGEGKGELPTPLRPTPRIGPAEV